MTASLRALRAFVEVVRCGGTAAAARKLSVSPSAVSHLLSDLEADLAVGLFSDRRRGRPSEAGARLYERLRVGFDTIDAALAEAAGLRSEIRLSTVSTFAALWLAPKLGRLHSLLPGTHLVVATDRRTVDLGSEPFDCVVRWGRGVWPGLDTTLLFRERLGIIGSPGLLAGKGAGGVWTLPRLQAHSRPEDWRRLLPDHLAGEHERHRVASFETRALMLEAALGGLGVAVLDLHLIAEPLRNGRLALATPALVDADDGYFFATRRGQRDTRRMRILRGWLVQEAAGA